MFAKPPDCQSHRGSLLKIKVPRPHPKLTETASSGREAGNAYCINAPGDADGRESLASTGEVPLFAAQRCTAAGGSSP